MARDPAALLDEALQLPPTTRARVSGQLLRSLDDAEPVAEPLLDQQECDAAWGAEIEQRLREVDSGAVKPIPWSVVRARLISGT